jgi:hypothetical protein
MMRRIWRWLTRPSLERFNRVVEASSITEYARLEAEKKQ